VGVAGHPGVDANGVGVAAGADAHGTVGYHGYHGAYGVGAVGVGAAGAGTVVVDPTVVDANANCWQYGVCICK
jgi:hypothetical protein